MQWVPFCCETRFLVLEADAWKQEFCWISAQRLFIGYASSGHPLRFRNQ
jgi:hypothetical protein